MCGCGCGEYVWVGGGWMVGGGGWVVDGRALPAGQFACTLASESTSKNQQLPLTHSLARPHINPPRVLRVEEHTVKLRSPRSPADLLKKD